LSVLGHLRVVFVTLAASGCIVFVSPIDTGEHCTIAGDSSCAACIRTKCQPTVDACCSATSCSGSADDGRTNKLLDSVDACGRGDRNACITNLSTPRLGAEDEALRTCVTSECYAECVEGGTIGSSSEGRATWTCGLPRRTDKPCAACIYDECAKALDDCCADSACSKSSAIQKDIGACVAGDEPGCAYLGKGNTSGFDGVVRACIIDSCADKCMGDGRPHASCNLYSGGQYCACTNAETSKGPECSSAKVGGNCVVGKDGCTCGSYSCGSTTDGCSCNFEGGNEGTSCSIRKDDPDSSAPCCIRLTDQGVSCKCSRYSGCYASLDEYGISSCDRDVVLAALDTASRVVTRCSR
jgi:hypothetical protein